MSRRAVGRGQVVDQLDDVVGKPVRAFVAGSPQRPRGDAIGPRGATETEVDPARMQGLERAELLGHDERRVVGEHDAARRRRAGVEVASARWAISTAGAELATAGMP